jgi:hypothetical protein
VARPVLTPTGPEIPAIQERNPMRDIIGLAHNIIAGEHHLIVQLLRDIDSRRSAASGSSGRQHRR